MINFELEHLEHNQSDELMHGISVPKIVHFFTVLRIDDMFSNG